MHLTKFENIILTIILTLAAGIVCFQIIGFDSLVSLAFNLSFVLVFFLWISVIFRKKANFDDLLIIIVFLLSIVFVLTNNIITEAVFSFDYFKKMIMFFSTLTFFQTMRRIEITDTMRKWIKNIISFDVVFICVSFFVFSKSKLYFLDGRVSRYLTFGFTNPNLAALFLFCLTAYEAAMIFEENNKAKRFIHLFFVVLLSWMIYETQSRNTLLCLFCLYIFAFIFIAFRKNKYSVNKLVALMISIFPLAFSQLYLWLYKTGFLNVFSFFSGGGKDLNARVSMWNLAYGEFIKSPILGAYSQISGGSGMSQMHNTHVDILASYGIVVFLIFLLWLYRLVINDQKRYSRKSFFCNLSFMCCLLLGMGEAAMFSGGLGIYLFAGIFLVLRNNPSEDIWVFDLHRKNKRDIRNKNLKYESCIPK